MQNKNSGFTLIELLVVVLIIGILAAVALPQYEKAVEKSRATEAITILNYMHKQAQLCALANGENCNSNTNEELGIELVPATKTVIVKFAVINIGVMTIIA